MHSQLLTGTASFATCRAAGPQATISVTTTGDTITVRLDRRAYSPVLRQADLPDTPVPWWGNRTLHYEFA